MLEAQPSPITQKIQPIGFSGRCAPTRAPTVTKDSAKTPTTAVLEMLRSSGISAGGLMARKMKASATSAAHNTHIDQATQEEARALIRLVPRPCSLASSVTTPLYSTTVSQALRKALRGRRFRANFGVGLSSYKLR